MARSVVGNRATSGSDHRPTTDRTINRCILRPIVRAILTSCDRAYDQSWYPTTDRTINRGIQRSIIRSATYNRSFDQSWHPTSDRTINRGVQRSIVRSIVATYNRSSDQSCHPMTDIRSIVGSNDRSYNQSLHPMNDHNDQSYEQSCDCSYHAQLLVRSRKTSLRPLTIWNRIAG